MSVAEVVLHIGAFKTGTSFIQQALALNRQRLATDGVLFPGRQWPEQVQAVRALAARGDPSAPIGVRGQDAWDRLAAECRGWEGERVIVSMEYLSAARPAVVRAAVASFAPAPVHVVLGARDLTHAVPAQWQESLQSGGRTWTLSEYAADVMRPAGEFSTATRHFWQKHNWPRVLGRWNVIVPSQRMTLMTFPRPGSDPSVLWHRFGDAAGFDASAYPLPALQNESLGAASLEVARRANLEAERQGFSTRRNVAFRRVLCKNVMAARRGSETSVVLPDGSHDWLRDRTEKLVRKVGRLGPRVVGELTDLVPQPMPPRPDATSRPDNLPVSVLAEAAEAAATGLARALGGPTPATAPMSDADRLESAIASVVAMVRQADGAPLPPRR